MRCVALENEASSQGVTFGSSTLIFLSHIANNAGKGSFQKDFQRLSAWLGFSTAENVSVSQFTSKLIAKTSGMLSSREGLAQFPPLNERENGCGLRPTSPAALLGRLQCRCKRACPVFGRDFHQKSECGTLQGLTPFLTLPSDVSSCLPYVEIYHWFCLKNVKCNLWFEVRKINMYIKICLNCYLPRLL